MLLLQRIVFFSYALGLTSAVFATEIWVDSRSTFDRPSGTQNQPFSNLIEALKISGPGDTIHLTPHSGPYANEIRINKSGTMENPLTLNGNGCIVSGRTVLPLDAWTREGDNQFSRPMPNNAWGMEEHWQGGFPLVWFDGIAGINCHSQAELIPGGYFLYKNRKEQNKDPLHNTLYIYLPTGKNYETAKVESITGLGGIFVGGDYVTVKNIICEYGGNDGFATHKNKGVIFDTVEARFFMDQGISNHGGEAVVSNSHFHHNAGGGIVDVYPEAKVRYENCLIEDDTWRGGVEFHSGTYEMIGCTIRNNAKKGLQAGTDAVVTLTDCRFIGDSDQSTTGANLTVGSFTIQGSSFSQFKTAINVRFKRNPTSSLHVRDCDFSNNQTSVRLTVERSMNTPDNTKFEFKDNHFDNNVIQLTTLTYNIDGSIQRKTEEVTAEQALELITKTTPQ